MTILMCHVILPCCCFRPDSEGMRFLEVMHCVACARHRGVTRPDLQVELPLGATEDRICGTIDIEKALQEGIKAYEPGLLVSTARIGCKPVRYMY